MGYLKYKYQLERSCQFTCCCRHGDEKTNDGKKRCKRFNKKLCEKKYNDSDAEAVKIAMNLTLVSDFSWKNYPLDIRRKEL